MLRLIVDANVYLSYFAARNPNSHLVIAIDSSLSSRNVDILVPDGVIQEIRRIGKTKEYFRQKIASSDLEQGIDILLDSGIALPPVEVKRSYSRDPADDYLVESALEYKADYLVTGDKDLRVLGRVGSVQVIPPEEIYWLLDAYDLLFGQKHHAPSPFYRFRLQHLGL